MMRHTYKKLYKLVITIFSLCIIFLMAGCSKKSANENANAGTKAMAQENPANGYEGEWYRTDVKSYQWARMMISNWKEGVSFDVVLLANYGDYGGSIEGTATFTGENMAVLYDENVEDFLKNQEGDHGIYFQLSDDSIIVTHDSNVRTWFGGGGIATAEGTYIHGEPEYTNCTDVGEIFTEKELKSIQDLLDDRYVPLFKNVIETGEITEYAIDNGRLWEAYRPVNGVEWCNILIYDDGRIYIEGYAYGDYPKEFYTNTDDTEMPDAALLKQEAVESNF